MAKTLIERLALDTEVGALVERIGSTKHAGNYIKAYTVIRENGQPTYVNVTFIADDEFSKAAPKEGEA